MYSQNPVQEFCLYFEDERRKTFVNWPFKDDCGCNSQSMAQAGFYACGSKSAPDLAKCFFCFKELEGWEPQDDPWEEHRKHSAECCFLKLGKKESEITVYEHVELLQAHSIFILKQEHKACKMKLEASFNDMMINCT